MKWGEWAGRLRGAGRRLLRWARRTLRVGKAPAAVGPAAARSVEPAPDSGDQRVALPAAAPTSRGDDAAAAAPGQAATALPDPTEVRQAVAARTGRAVAAQSDVPVERTFQVPRPAWFRKMRARLAPQAPPRPLPETVGEPVPRPAPELPPGQWISGAVTAVNGQMDLAPWVPPHRAYWIHEPAALAATPSVLVLLHGCRQSADEIAEGTRLNEHADRHGWLVLYPEQTLAANKHRCWNWFDPANLRGDGECALVIAMLQAVLARYSLSNAHAFLTGMSAGGALASLLALRYSHVWSGVAIHSGLPYGAASDPWAAMRAMREGSAGLGLAHALRAEGTAVPVPAMILHGTVDTVVDRRNADLLVRQFLGWNGYLPAAADWDTAPLPPAAASRPDDAGHAYVLRDYSQPLLAPVRECEVLDMGHAWSGGDGALPFHDELGPDGSALMMDFFAGIARTTPAPGKRLH